MRSRRCRKERRGTYDEFEGKEENGTLNIKGRKATGKEFDFIRRPLGGGKTLVVERINSRLEKSSKIEIKKYLKNCWENLTCRVKTWRRWSVGSLGERCDVSFRKGEC